MFFVRHYFYALSGFILYGQAKQQTPYGNGLKFIDLIENNQEDEVFFQFGP